MALVQGTANLSIQQLLSKNSLNPVTGWRELISTFATCIWFQVCNLSHSEKQILLDSSHSTAALTIFKVIYLLEEEAKPQSQVV